MHLTMGNGEMIAVMDWTEEDRFKLVPGSGRNSRGKFWHCPLTWSSLVMLRSIFGHQLTYDDAIRNWAAWERQRVEAALMWRYILDIPPNPDDPLSEKMFPFQRADVQFMLAAGSGILGNEAGTGKTVALESLVRERSRLGMPTYPLLIICPFSLRHHWAARIPTWLPEAVDHTYVIEGTGLAARRKVLARAAEDPQAVIIINIETLSRFSKVLGYGSIRLKMCRECDPNFGDESLTSAKCQTHRKELNNIDFRGVIIDEGHRVGQPKTQWTRAVWAVAHAPGVAYRWCATGTPDNIEHMWSMLHTVAPREFPTKSKWLDYFGQTQASPFGMAPDWIGFRLDHRAEAFRCIDPYFRRVIKSVVLPQLPPVLRKVVHVDMTKAMRKSYTDLADRLYTVMPDGDMLITKTKLASRGRLMQFASATVEIDKPDEDDVSTWKIRMVAPSPKIDEMERIVTDIGEQSFVVACQSRDLVTLASERLEKMGVKHEVIAGGVSSQAAQLITERLSNGTVRAIVFTIAAGGTGLDMSGAGVMIRLQRSDSLRENIQTEERNNRPGAEIHSRLLLIDVITADTVEMKQMENLSRAMEQYEQITRDRATLEQQLQNLSPETTDYADAVAKLQALSVQFSSIATKTLDTEDE